LRTGVEVPSGAGRKSPGLPPADGNLAVRLDHGGAASASSGAPASRPPAKVSQAAKRGSPSTTPRQSVTTTSVP
jgi:hypothetical protein